MSSTEWVWNALKYCNCILPSVACVHLERYVNEKYFLIPTLVESALWVRSNLVNFMNPKHKDSRNQCWYSTVVHSIKTKQIWSKCNQNWEISASNIFKSVLNQTNWIRMISNLETSPNSIIHNSKLNQSSSCESWNGVFKHNLVKKRHFMIHKPPS